MKSKKDGDDLIKANTILTPLAVTSKAYIAETQEGKMIQIPFGEVKVIKQEPGPANGLATSPSLSSKKL
jgi:hypothetical protein